jgi:RNA polymerase sigma factor (sigma-70 family)
MKPENQIRRTEERVHDRHFNFDLNTERMLISEPLWESLKAGDTDSFEKIFKAFYGPLLNYGIRFNSDREEVKDCIQILFIKIWERRESLGASDSIRNYLLASLRRLIIKRMNATKNTFISLDDNDIEFYADLSVEAKLIHDQTSLENINALQNAIGKLPNRQKEALFLRFYSDQSFADIAEVMNISTRAVYKLIYKALDSLNEELAPHSRSIPLLLALFFSLSLDPLLDLTREF